MAAYFKVDRTRELICAPSHWGFQIFLVHEVFHSPTRKGSGHARLNVCHMLAWSSLTCQAVFGQPKKQSGHCCWRISAVAHILELGVAHYSTYVAHYGVTV